MPKDGSLILRPRLKSYLTLYPMDDRTWGIRGGDGEYWSLRLREPEAMRCLAVALPFLDGSGTREEILAGVRGAGLEVRAGEELLQRLEEADLIEDADDAGLTDAQLRTYRDQIKLFSRFAKGGGAGRQADLLDARIAVVGDDALGEALCRALVKSGVGRVTAVARDLAERRGDTCAHEVLALEGTGILPQGDMEPPPRVVVAAQTAHDPELLEAMDVFSKKHHVPWLLVRAIDHAEAWVGPLFVPRDTASYVSFEGRLRGNMANYDSYVAFDDHVRRPDGRAADAGGLHAFHDVLAGIAVAEVVKFVTGIMVPVLAGRFLSINLWTLETELHEVLRLPRLEEESYARPGVFPWKELPHGRTTRRA